MKQKGIGLLMLIVGLGVIGFWGMGCYKMLTYPFTGSTAQAKIIGYKISSNGARMVQKDNASSKLFAARSPFFEFTINNQTIKAYSKSPQLITFLNYKISDEVLVAFPQDLPKNAVIVYWKEVPGLVFMIGFGLLILLVGKSYLFQK